MRWTRRAFTLPELLIILTVIAVITFFVLPAMLRMKARASRVHCVNNQKNITVAFRIFASDNNDLFPFQVPVTNGGTLELRTNIIAQFQATSNELATPKIIICPDRVPQMSAATSFATLTRTNIGYFVSLSASHTNPDSILLGDAGFAINGAFVSNCIVQVMTNDLIRYPPGLHGDRSRPPAIACSDGSVRSGAASNWIQYLSAVATGTNLFLLP